MNVKAKAAKAPTIVTRTAVIIEYVNVACIEYNKLISGSNKAVSKFFSVRRDGNVRCFPSSTKSTSGINAVKTSHITGPITYSIIRTTQIYSNIRPSFSLFSPFIQLQILV